MQLIRTAMPLRVRKDGIGALNFYSASVPRFGADDAEVAGLFARQASIMLAHGLAYSTSTNT